MSHTCAKKIVIKISGEFLDKPPEYNGINNVIKFISDLNNMGHSVAIVVGGGNILRGHSKHPTLPRFTLDNMGMLATVINGIALTDALNDSKIPSMHYSSIQINGIVDRCNINNARDKFTSGTIIIYSGGIGATHFSTDTVAIIRALELECDLVLKFTNVAGVYDKDPSKHKDAQLIQHVTYRDIITNDLRIMDMASIALAKEGDIPIYVFSGQESAENIINKKTQFTIIDSKTN